MLHPVILTLPSDLGLLVKNWSFSGILTLESGFKLFLKCCNRICIKSIGIRNPVTSNLEAYIIPKIILLHIQGWVTYLN